MNQAINKISEADNKRLNELFESVEQAITRVDTWLIRDYSDDLNDFMNHLSAKYEFSVLKQTVDPRTGVIVEFKK